MFWIFGRFRFGEHSKVHPNKISVVERTSDREICLLVISVYDTWESCHSITSRRQLSRADGNSQTTVLTWSNPDRCYSRQVHNANKLFPFIKSPVTLKSLSYCIYMSNFKNPGVSDFMCVNKADKWTPFPDCFTGSSAHENNNHAEIKSLVLMSWFKLKRISCENEWTFFFTCRSMALQWAFKISLYI